ncbi:type 4a pilus biogenesis protein PilO [Kineococcus rubinsiae]|uniref:type 4a pilus biogenesis protein PilO n=1 Tax=Kineococcus rubinsiae TaxID=2609562 RepID=UPI001431D84F|nr:type 4a pilus biogenesis protein PilO [Kineococcus rubinsiae]NIZ89853.1 type 4a pilus biogenesis protein PilO [Kineococcus rubinsiae]
MTMRKSTLWTLATALIALLVLAGGWLLVLGPQRAEAADLATQRNFVAEQNERLALNQAQLQAQLEELPAQKAQLAAILASLPDDSRLPQLLRQLESSAENTGVRLTSVAPGTAAAYDATGAPGVVSVPVVVSVDGTLAEVELYLKQLQADSTRYFLIESVALSAGTGGVSGTSSGISTVITGKVFVLSASASAATPAIAGTTAPAPTTAVPGGTTAGTGPTTLS